jgi:hypothetical protein
MPKSRNKRANGKVKSYVQKDPSGNPIRKRDKKPLKDIRIKQMMRTQMLNQACESLTSAEVKLAIEKGKGHTLSYITTVLDGAGVPVDGETKTLTLASLDIARLDSILKYKERSEKAMQTASIQ